MHISPPRNKKDPGSTRLDDYNAEFIPNPLRIHKLVKRSPRINSKHLFKYDWSTQKTTNINLNWHIKDVKEK